MSRLDIKTPSKAQMVVEHLYRSMEHRIEASPPGLCPIDMALNFLNLCHAQTCGKCVPCRVGLGQLSDLLHEVLDGRPSLGHPPADRGHGGGNRGLRGLRHRRQRRPAGADGPPRLPGRL